MLRAESLKPRETNLDNNMENNTIDQTIIKNLHEKFQKNPIGYKIMEVLFHVAMAALRAGETLERWTNVYSSMIKKVKGVIHL